MKENILANILKIIPGNISTVPSRQALRWADNPLTRNIFKIVWQLSFNTLNVNFFYGCLNSLFSLSNFYSPEVYQTLIILISHCDCVLAFLLQITAYPHFKVQIGSKKCTVGSMCKFRQIERLLGRKAKLNNIMAVNNKSINLKYQNYTLQSLPVLIIKFTIIVPRI